MLITSSLGDHTIRAAQAGQVRIEEIRVAASNVGRQAPTERPRHVQIAFVLHGNIQLRDRGNALHLGASGWSIVDASCCALAAAPGTHAIVVTLAELGQSATRSAAHSASMGVGRVLLSLARSTLEAAEQLNEATLTEIGNSLTELTRIALRDDAGPPQRLPVRTVLCERVKSFVQRHLRQSSLSIDYIASHFRCTKRHLHNVFGASACSLSQFIWGLRLDRCAEDLKNDELGDRSVTAIAFSWGFSSPSHFSRAFRQRFGVPPSVYRASRLVAHGRASLGRETGSHLAA